VLEILRQIIREPTLPDSEFEVMKNEQTAGVEQGRSDPIRQGLNHILRLLSQYKSDDVRYVPTIDEKVERLKKVALDQVQTLYRDYLGAEHGELVVIGDFEPSEVMPILAKTFDGWKSDKPYARIEQPYHSDIKPQRETIQTSDKANAVYLAGLSLPIKDDHPDYPALLAGNFILGGGALSSRIADRLRQKGGLSYGAGSFFAASPLDPKADLMILAIYNPANVDKVVTGVADELNRLLRDGVAQAELDKAKDGYIQQQKVTRTNDMTLSVALLENLFVGRTMQFQADLEDKIKALTPAVVEAALRKHLDPKQLSIVTAGDFKK
jgi:zinc protease